MSRGSDLCKGQSGSQTISENKLQMKLPQTVLSPILDHCRIMHFKCFHWHGNHGI